MKYLVIFFVLFGLFFTITIPDTTAQYIGNSNSSEPILEERLGTSVSKLHQIHAEQRAYEQQIMLMVSLGTVSFVSGYAIYRAFTHNKKTQ